ncbi:MAG: hypothetical protein RBT03_09115 [Kiritimatiellia bacterium]|jgi:hypothetical protein|nr:hypothetical protein [Kiritimatiellia bacterium]
MRAAKYSDSGGLWLNGGSPKIDLPENAAPEKVIAQAIQKQPFDQGLIKTYTILETRPVMLSDLSGNPTEYTAAHIESDLGEKVLIFNFKTFGYWWIRFYDPKQKRAEQLRD